MQVPDTHLAPGQTRSRVGVLGGTGFWYVQDEEVPILVRYRPTSGSRRVFRSVRTPRGWSRVEYLG